MTDQEQTTQNNDSQEPDLNSVLKSAPDESGVNKEAVDLYEKNEEKQTGKPDWLPDKFSSPEELANAYKELESKLGSTRKEEEKEDKHTEDSGQTILTPKGEKVPVDHFSKYSEYLQENDTLAEDHYKELADMGFDKSVVDMYVEVYKQAMSANTPEGNPVVQKVYSIVGGKESYQKMAEWAQDNLQPFELMAYDTIVNSGDEEKIVEAVNSLWSKYKSNNSSPQLYSGTSSGVQPFSTQSEMIAAFNDPRYKTDESYRRLVSKRMAVSSNIIDGKIMINGRPIS